MTLEKGAECLVTYMIHPISYLFVPTNARGTYKKITSGFSNFTCIMTLWDMIICLVTSISAVLAG